MTLALTYGIVLGALAIYCAGAGHGSYLLLGVAGAPFSYFGIPAAIAAAFAQWPLLVLALRKASPFGSAVFICSCTTSAPW
jgi:hypothetical protein